MDNNRTGKPEKPINPVKSLKRHFVMLTIVGMAGSVILCLAIFKKIKPTYTAEALIKIAPITTEILYDHRELHNTSFYLQHVESQARIIQNPDLLEKTIESMGDQKYLWMGRGEVPRNAAERLAARLQVENIKNTQLIRIALERIEPEGIDVIINSVLNTYLEVEKEQSLSRDYFRQSFLREKVSELEGQLERQYGELGEFTELIGSNMYTETGNRYSVGTSRLLETYIQAKTTHMKARNELEEVRESVHEKEELPVEPEILHRVEQNQALWYSISHVNNMISELRDNIVGLTPGHPDRMQAEEIMKELNVQLSDLHETARSGAETIVVGQLENTLKTILIEAEARADAARKTMVEIEDEYIGMKEKASELSITILKAEKLKEEIERTQTEINKMKDRILQIEVEARAPSKNILISRAHKPMGPQADKRPKLMVAAAIFSFLCAFILVVMIDKLDSRIHESSDLELVLGGSPTAVIPRSVDLNAETPTALPSTLAEPFKRLALRIARECDNIGSGLISVTSTSSGGGTTVVSRNLASFLAASGYSPVVATYGNGDSVIDDGENDIAFSYTRLRSTDDFSFDAVEVSGDVVLKSRAELLETLKCLSTKYSHIILDTPPVAANADTEMISSCADIAVIVVPTLKSNFENTSEALALLEKAGVKVVCPVINYS